MRPSVFQATITGATLKTSTEEGAITTLTILTAAA